MKKIGILTLYHENYNYGGLLQAYALCKYLNTQEFVEAEQITYSISVESTTLVQKILYYVVNPRFLISVLSERFIKSKIYDKKVKRKKEKGKELFRCFIQDIPHSKVLSKESLWKVENKYDMFIVGGDQVWNPEWYDTSFYLPFVPSVKKISYSASIGKDKLTESEVDNLLEFISDFKAVSVREQSIISALENSHKKADITQVLDPVFLLEVEQWKELTTSCPKIEGEYIFVYLLGEDKKVRKKIEEFAAISGLKIYTIPYPLFKYNFVDKDFGSPVWNVGPREFISLIGNASYVFTDSFHGTAFSIIFNRNFYSFRKKSKNVSNHNSRMIDLLELFGLSDRYIDDLEDKFLLNDIINYETVNSNIAYRVKESRDWLIKQLGNS